MSNKKEIPIIYLGNGDIAITQTVDPELNKVSLMFSQLDTVGRLGEKIENDVGVPIGEIVFDNVDGLENLISILKILKKRVYRDNHFYKKMLP